MEINKLNSIHQFFTLIDCDYQCYDIGRNIHPLNKHELSEFEQTQHPCTTPFLQHTWLAILFWPANSDRRSNRSSDQPPPATHFVWFIKLPLDEQARLNLAARDDFLKRLYDALNQYLLAIKNSNKHQLHTLEKAMKDNPYGFQPKPEQMANFHALAQKHLRLPPSHYYESVQSWFAGDNQFSHWEELGFQGLADFAARLDENYSHGTVTNTTPLSNEQLLINALAHIPAPPFPALSSCLENHPVSADLSQAIYQRTEYELTHNTDPQSLASFCAAAIRAASQSQSAHQPARFILQILESPVGRDIEVLAAVSGRCWQSLKKYEVLMPWLEVLAKTEHGQGAFNAVLADLMYIPGMREPVLQAFRSPERSRQLSQAIGAFFGTLQKTGGRL